MLEVPISIENAKNSSELLRELSYYLPTIIPISKSIIKTKEKRLYKIARPVEWTSSNSLNEIDNQKLLQLVDNSESKSIKYKYHKLEMGENVYTFSPISNNISPIDIILVSSQEIPNHSLIEILDLLNSITKKFIILLKNDCLKYAIPFNEIYPTLDYDLIKNEVLELKDSLAKNEYITKSLFEFSKSLAESENISTQISNSLRNLCQVTSCEKAVCFANTDHKNPETISYLGGYNFDQKSIDSVQIEELISWTQKNNETIILPFLKNNSVHKNTSAIIVPLIISKKSLGVILLICRNVKIISEVNLSFIESASALLALAINQHNFIQKSAQIAEISEKIAKQNSALYKFTHSITSQQNLEEVFQIAFQIMHEELKIPRFWLGLLNEPGTRIIGQSAFGIGWKRKLIEVNIDISGQNHPLASVIKSRELLVVRDVDDILKGLGLKKFNEKHNIQEMTLVPLISSTQIIGVIAYESNANYEVQKTMKMFASELSNVIFAKRLEERMTAGETMRAAGLLAAGIAHNFNNLLQGILGQASLIELYADNPDQIKKSAKNIADSSAKGASLVKQLMSFAYLEDPSHEIFNLNNLIELNKINFQRLLKSDQFIRYFLSQTIQDVDADPKQILRIINTLLTNASEAMDNNGIVEIITDNVLVNEESPHFDVPYGDYVTLGIRDNGMGMDLETKRRCFEPFFSTKNIDKSSGLSLQGSGMSLAAAYALAKKNGGRLIVDSRKGHGSLFTLYIPRAVHVLYEKSDNLREPSTSKLLDKIEVIRTEEDLPKQTKESDKKHNISDEND